MGEAVRGNILKIVNLALIIILTGLGCVAHFDDEGQSEISHTEGLEGTFKPYPNCVECPSRPNNISKLEKIFVSFTIIPLIILTLISAATFFKTSNSKINIADFVSHIVCAILLLIAGALLLAAALRLDKFWYPSKAMDAMDEAELEDAKIARGTLRGKVWYGQKITAGVLCIFAFITSLVVGINSLIHHKNRNEFQPKGRLW